MTEKQKYDIIYSENKIPGYGHSNCGKNFLPFLNDVKSLVDIGCGHNQFSKLVKKQNPSARVLGVDFSCPSADIIANATSLPFKRKEFEWATSFDMLEHLLPEEVDIALGEISRVSTYFCFSICYRDSVYKINDLTLHPTVRSEEWWTKKIEKAGGVVQKTGRYLYGKWGKKLSIGMTVFDDWDGFYFTIQSIRMYHKNVLDDIEFIIINTNADSSQGKEVKRFCMSGNVKNLRYFEDSNDRGTATRDKIFSYSESPYVLIIDSHVFLEENSIEKLIKFYDDGKDESCLLQGPLLNDDLSIGPCKFNVEWRSGMYGTWGYDQRAKDDEPFEIPAQGLGLFSSRKRAWMGFHPQHEKFGGEEIYIHDKFIESGKKTLCLPFLKWLHRFSRPSGVSYPIDWKSRVQNYMREFLEINKPVYEIIEHFKTLGLQESKLREWLSDVIK